MAFEHECGTIYDARVPPADCEFCVSLLVKVTKGMPFRGWRHIPGTKGGPKSKRRAEAKERRRRTKNKRRRIGPDRRRRLYVRDKYTCQNPTCGRHLPPDDPLHHLLTLDHIIPVSKGGTNRDNNLQAMCRTCNGKKGNAMPTDVDEPKAEAARRRQREGEAADERKRQRMLAIERRRADALRANGRPHSYWFNGIPPKPAADAKAPATV